MFETSYLRKKLYRNRLLPIIKIWQQVNKATLVIEKIRDHSRELVDETELVSEELVNVSMLWIDVWQEGLDSKRITLCFITIDYNIPFVVKGPSNKLI